MTDDKHVIDDKHLVFDVNTVEEALDLASRQWGVPAEELRSEVIGSEKVFLGLFGKKLKVEVTLPECSLLCKGRDFVDDLLKLMDLRAEGLIPKLSPQTSGSSKPTRTFTAVDRKSVV